MATPSPEIDLDDPATWPMGAYRCRTKTCINSTGVLNMRQPGLSTPVVCGGCGSWMHAPDAEKPNPASKATEQGFVPDLDL